MPYVDDWTQVVSGFRKDIKATGKKVHGSQKVLSPQELADIAEEECPAEGILFTTFFLCIPCLCFFQE